MSSTRGCTHCSRMVGQVWRASRQTHLEWTIFQRSFISTTIRRHNANPTPDPRPNTQPPPFTAGTITTNVTAPMPEPSAVSQNQEPKKAVDGTPALSTAQMQKEIQANLNRGSGATFTKTLAQKLRKTAKSTTESYITYGLTEAFFKSCAAQAPYTIPEDQRAKILTEQGPPKTAEGEDVGIAEANTWWFQELGFQPTFSTWSQVALLHMYLLSVRLRAIEDRSAYTNYQRYLTEHFSHTAEDKMLLVHNINARGIRNRYLKDLFLQWRGLLAAYDEGLAKGDAVLAAALWRNLWKGRDDVDWEKVAAVVAYMRSAIYRLGHVELDELVHNLDSGANVWSSARADVRQVQNIRSKGIDQALSE